MRKLSLLLLPFLLVGCASKEVQLAELTLEAQKLTLQDKQKDKELEMIKEINAPKELLVLKGCGTGCEATLFNPFHGTKLPTNEHDVAIHKVNAIKETITGVVTPIVASKVLKTNTRVAGDIAIAAIQGAGHNTSISGQNSTVAEDNDVTETTTVTEDNDTTTTTTTTSTATTSTQTQTETHENSHNTNQNPVTTTTTTTTTKEETKDESEENNP